MKLSFSTRGWQRLGWDELLETAEDTGLNGLEIYDLPKREDLVSRGNAFHKYNIVATTRQLRERGLQIPCFDTNCDISLDGTTDYLLPLMETARNMSVSYVSAVAILGDEDTVRSNLAVLLPAAEKSGITLLMKTTGIYSDTGRLRELMDEFASDQLAALWDIHHPYRYFDEAPEYTYSMLKDRIMYLHVKDSVVFPDGSLKYKMMGYGDVPVAETLRILKENGYDGYVTLEWVKRWYSDLEEPGVVFLQYISYVNRKLRHWFLTG